MGEYGYGGADAAPAAPRGDGRWRVVPHYAWGKGANQAVAAARLGATVRLIGRVGADPFGAAARENLRRYGVDTAGLRCDASEPSGVALIFVDRRGERDCRGAGRQHGADGGRRGVAGGLLAGADAW